MKNHKGTDKEKLERQTEREKIVEKFVRNMKIRESVKYKRKPKKEKKRKLA